MKGSSRLTLFLSFALAAFVVGMALARPNSTTYGTGEGGSWEALSPTGSPGERWGFAAVWDPQNERMLLFSGERIVGEDQIALDDLWSYDPGQNAWTNLSPNGTPPPTTSGLGYTAVWDSKDQRILFFGGTVDVGVDYFNALWSYNPAANSWTEKVPVGQRPPERQGHTAVWDPTTERMLVFGNTQWSGFELTFDNDLWAFDPNTSTWTRLAPAGQQPPTEGIAAARAVWDSVNGGMLVFLLEHDVSSPDSDSELHVWLYQPVANEWTELGYSGPNPTRSSSTFSAVWDTQDDRVLAILQSFQICLPKAGGYGSPASGSCEPPPDRAWAYDPSTGTGALLSVETGPQVAGEDAVWEPQAKRVLIYGRPSGEIAPGLWAFSPSAEPKPTSPPTATPPPTSTETPLALPLTVTPVATPTATAVPPATSTPTPAPAQPLGDVTCDGLVNPVDAALILQFAAGLIDAMPCGGSADVNEDGRTDPIDASLILQFAAGLIAELPP